MNADDEESDEMNCLLCAALAAREPPPARRGLVRDRLLVRVGRSLDDEAGLLTVRSREGSWQNVKSGVRAKTLHDGAHGSSVLIELQAGALLPVHRHAWLEEGIVLAGGMQLGELDLGPGDYHVSPPGSRHGRIGSRQGAVAYLRGTALGRTGAVIGELLGGLLPGSGPPPVTVGAGDGEWRHLGGGAGEKLLWHDGEIVSRFVRLQAGGRLPARAGGADEECMMLEGDAYFGDRLLCAGDFHLAPAGSRHGDFSSDAGALFFLRGRRDPGPP